MSDLPGDGEQQERTRRRRRLAILTGLSAMGALVGALVATGTAPQGSRWAEPWPPLLAAVLAFGLAAAMIVGSVVLWRQFDEVEQAVQQRAAYFAAIAWMIAYPIWFILWKGGLVQEPGHLVLYVGFLATMALATYYYRYR